MTVASLLATFPILATRRSSGSPNSGAGHRFAELVPATQRPAAIGDRDGPEEGVGTLSSVRWPRFSAQLLWPLSSGSQPRQEHWLTRESGWEGGTVGLRRIAKAEIQGTELQTGK